jgi:hypothetical protein
VVDPFWGGRKEKLTERTSSTVRCGRPEVVVDSSGVRGGCTRRRSARGVVESVGERPEWAVHGGSVAAGTAAQWGAKSGGGRKGAPRWGWAPFIAARGGGRRRWGNSGWENGGGEAVGKGKAVAVVV